MSVCVCVCEGGEGCSVSEWVCVAGSYMCKNVSATFRSSHTWSLM